MVGVVSTPSSDMRLNHAAVHTDSCSLPWSADVGILVLILITGISRAMPGEGTVPCRGPNKTNQAASIYGHELLQ